MDAKTFEKDVVAYLDSLGLSVSDQPSHIFATGVNNTGFTIMIMYTKRAENTFSAEVQHPFCVTAYCIAPTIVTCIDEIKRLINSSLNLNRFFAKGGISMPLGSAPNIYCDKVSTTL